MAADTHRCPAPGCQVQVPYDQLACRGHWYSIPKPLRNALWRAWNHHGPGTQEHADAMDGCVAYLESRRVA